MRVHRWDRSAGRRKTDVFRCGLTTCLDYYSLDGVGFIQFVGKGTITKFDIFGFGSIE